VRRPAPLTCRPHHIPSRMHTLTVAGRPLAASLCCDKGPLAVHDHHVTALSLRVRLCVLTGRSRRGRSALLARRNR
jgi:hypothetical protein